MPSKAKFYYYWDSCVFISHLNGHPDRVDDIRDVLAYVQNHKDVEIITSSMSVAEVVMTAKEKNMRKLDPDVENQIRLMWYSWGIKVIEANPVIMGLARDFARSAIPEKVAIPKPPDAIHLATAMWVGKELGVLKEVHTYEDKWNSRYSSLVDGLKICKPYKPAPTIS